LYTGSPHNTLYASLLQPYMLHVLPISTSLISWLLKWSYQSESICIRNHFMIWALCKPVAVTSAKHCQWTNRKSHNPALNSCI
jgi:hypothetical protein